MRRSLFLFLVEGSLLAETQVVVDGEIDVDVEALVVEFQNAVLEAGKFDVAAAADDVVAFDVPGGFWHRVVGDR